MKKTITRLLVAATLLVGLLGATAATTTTTAEASGYCSTAYVWLHDGRDGTGTARKICYGINEVDLDGPVTKLNVGPDAVGNYWYDFVKSNGLESGIESITLWDAAGGPDANVCIYCYAAANTAPPNVIGIVHTNGTYNFPPGGPILGDDVTLG